MNDLLERLRYHVTGAIERGEKQAIAGITDHHEQPAGGFDGYHQFTSEVGEDEYGCFEVFYDDADEANGHARNFDGDGEPVQAGWYWWACFPGCLPDGDPSGPFATAKEAFDDARLS